MSQTQIEKKVEDYLRNSQTLEDYWHRPITADQLQAEMERMASNTKQPEVLQELFAALGNDPFVIAECLARPILAERLVREQSNVASGRDESPSRPFPLARPAVAPYQANVPYQLPVIANPSGSCTDDTWTPTTLIFTPAGRQASYGSLDRQRNDRVGRRRRAVVFQHRRKIQPGHRQLDGHEHDQRTRCPSEHTAVWTGSEMIVWGGSAERHI